MEFRPRVGVFRLVVFRPYLRRHNSSTSTWREVLDLVSSLVKKASESLNIDFALLLSYWKKRISTTLQVKFILEASVSKRNPQRRQDTVDSALLETYHVRAAQ